MSRKSDVLHIKLSKIVGADRVRTDNLEKLMYSHDLASLPKMMELGFKMIPDAVVQPKSAEEVSSIIKVAVSESVPIVPRGGASWGYGGAVPCEGGIVLDMTSMNRILRIDEENMEVEVEAGAIWQKVHDEALARGLYIGYYPSSAPAATVAGWISTGGIGVGSYKYGAVGANVRNMEVVLPEGQILQTGFDRVSDHSSGYGLNGLFIGNEGTLGVMTRVTLKAVPAPEVIKPVSIIFPDLNALWPLLRAVTRSRIEPLHISFADQFHGQYLNQIGRHSPGEGATLNVVLEGAKGYVEWEEGELDRLVGEHGGTRLSDEDAQHHWEENPYEFRVREIGISAALGEVVVPAPTFPDFVAEVYGLIDKMKMEASILGMMGDRNTVLVMPYYMYLDRKMIKSMASLAFPKKLGDLAMAHGGRPLGFGLFFAQNLKKVRGQGADVMYDIKTVLDPHDILNPGKLFEGLTRYGMPIPGVMMNLSMNAMGLGKKIMPKDKAFKKKAKEHAAEAHKHE